MLLSKIDAAVTRVRDTGIYSLLTGTMVGLAAIAIALYASVADSSSSTAMKSFAESAGDFATIFIIVLMVITFGLLAWLATKKTRVLWRWEQLVLNLLDMPDTLKEVSLTEAFQAINDVEAAGFSKCDNYYNLLEIKFKAALKVPQEPAKPDTPAPLPAPPPVAAPASTETHESSAKK